MTTTEKFKEIFSYQSSSFKEWFGGMDFEESTKELHSTFLEKDMTDKEILEELKPTEVSLGDMLYCLKSLDKTERNIFYIRDKSGVLRAVRVDWYNGGWDVNAFSVENPDDWDDIRVFSRNSFILSDTLTLERAIGICVMNGYKVSKD